MNITKIKLNLIETIICYVTDKDKTEKSITLKCSQPRLPVFTKAFAEIIPLIVQMIDLPAHWDYADTAITEIKIDRTEKATKYHATLLRKHQWFTSAITVKTPSFSVEQMVGDLEYKLIRIQEHASDFIAGKRGQRDMFADEKVDMTISTIDPETGEILSTELTK